MKSILDTRSNLYDMSLSKVIEVAQGELGYAEDPPGSNRTKYGEAFGWDGVPWCAIFLWWCFREAGEGKAYYGGAKTASCGTLFRWYRAQGQTVSADDIRIGDIVILNFSGTQDTQHCGLVVGVGEKGKIYTVEGNTTPRKEGSQNNGGCVASKVRYPYQVVAVARPKYKEEPMKPDYEGHWAEKTIKKAIRKGVLKGYENGTYQPDKPVTRAELMVILERLGLLE